MGLDIHRMGEKIRERTETQVRTSGWNTSDALGVFLGSPEFNTHLLRVSVVAVTELQVILEHAGRRDRQWGTLEN